MDVFNLQASIGLDTSKFLSGIKNAISAGQSLKINTEDSAESIKKEQIALDTLKNKLEIAKNATSAAAEKVAYLQDNFNEYAKTTGTASEETMTLYEALEKAERELANCEKAEQNAANELENYAAQAESAGTESDGAADSNRGLADETRGAGEEAKTAGDRFAEFADNMKNVASTVGDVVATIVKAGTAIAGTVTAATTGAIAATVKGVSELAAYGDTIDKQSQKVGISAQAYQEWDAIMQHSGASIGSMTASMRTLVSAAQSDSDALKALGISQKEALGMGQEELFSTVITRLQNTEDQTQRTYLATKLLGRGAMEFGALLNTSAEDTEKMRQRVHELGGVLSDTAVKDAARFQDSLQDMQTGFEGVKRKLLSDFMPSFATVMDGITDIFAGDASKGQVEISNGLAKVSRNIDEVLPKVLALADYFGEAAEKALPVVGGVFDKVADHIIDAMAKIDIGELIDKALDIVNIGADKVEKVGDALFGLIDGAISELPGKLPAIAGTINTLVTKLIGGISTIISSDGVDDLLDAAIKAVLSIAENLASNVEPLANAALKLLTSIMTVVLNNLDDIISTASTIIQTILDAMLKDNGILDGVVKLVSAIADGIVENSDAIMFAVQNLITAIWDRVQEPETAGKLTEAGATIIAKMLEGLTSAAGSILGFAVSMFGEFVETVFTTDFPGIGLSVVNGIRDGLFENDAIKEFTEHWIETFDNFGGQLYDNVEKLKKDVQDKFNEFVENAKSWGTDMIQNFIDGITGKWTALTNTVSSAAQIVRDYLGFSEPKLGPLSSFHEFAPDMIDLFTKGIEDNAYKIGETFDKSLDVEANAGISATATVSTTANGSGNSEIVSIMREILDEIKKGKTISVSAIDTALGQLQSMDERTDFA